jgi:CRISPR system Cascade subunit CasD
MYVAIRLKSHMQSWGDDSKAKTRGSQRNTFQRPSISGVYGLLATCLGIKKNTEEYQEFTKSVKYNCTLTFKHHFETMTDYHTFGGGYDSSNSFEKLMIPRTVEGKIPTGVGGTSKLTCREYLVNADFIVIVEVIEEYVNRLENALKNPEWVPSFGRACCIPSERIFIATSSTINELVQIAKSIYKTNKLYIWSNHDIGGANRLTYDTPINGREYKNTCRVEYENMI